MITLSDELEQNPRDFARIWWSGSYPHNKITSGLNAILKRRNLPIKLSIDHKNLTEELAHSAYALCFNHEVQTELRQVAQRLLINGHTLIVARRADPLCGELHLYLLPANTPWQAGSLHAIALDDPYATQQRQALNTISINGLAAQAPQQQEDFFSARYSLDYDEVRRRLTDHSLNTNEFRRTIQPQEKNCVARGSWFSILGYDSDGHVLVQLASSSRRGASSACLKPLDWSLLTFDIGLALQALSTSPPLLLLQIYINTREESNERFLLPLVQWDELAQSLQKIPPQTGAAVRHTLTS